MTSEPDTITELDLGVVPEAAVSRPMLLQTDYRTVLTFNAMKHTPDKRVTSVGTAIVEFERCLVTKFGYPNDEALQGHPLYQRGLAFYSCYEVLNSSWLAEIDAQNRQAFPDSTGSPVRHFVFTFHDSTFECLAADLKLTLSDEPTATLLTELTREIAE
jgi:hypothetical protein